MNTKEYILSGIVESYILGMATTEEADEFERMCATHAEVQAASDAFEQQLEKTALSVGIAPPRHLKSHVLSEIEIDAQKFHPRIIQAEPTDKNKPSPITFTPTIWKYLAAASIILLVGSTALNFYFFGQYRKYSNEYSNLLASQSEMANNVKALEIKANNFSTALNMLRDSNMAVVKLKGVDKHPSGLATVFWDKRSKDVYLMVDNLPKAPAGKQYQLWAIVDGRPVDAGLLTFNQQSPFFQMKRIPSAQAFAITLEREGGNNSPSMDEMYVMGNM